MNNIYNRLKLYILSNDENLISDNIGDKLKSSPEEVTADHITQVLKNSKNREIKLNAIKHPAFNTDHVTQALKDRDPFVRSAAISHPAAVHDHFLQALKDKNKDVMWSGLKRIHGVHTNNEEYEAGRVYNKDSGYKGINSQAYYMANGRYPPDESESTLSKEESEKHIHHLDAAINKHELPCNLKISRGISSSLGNKLLAAPAGKIHVQHSFMSTSIDPDLSAGFGNNHMIIGTLPRGQKYTLPRLEHNKEEEVLLPRNTRYKKIKTVKDKYGVYNHHVKFLP